MRVRVRDRVSERINGREREKVVRRNVRERKSARHTHERREKDGNSPIVALDSSSRDTHTHTHTMASMAR